MTDMIPAKITLYLFVGLSLQICGVTPGIDINKTKKTSKTNFYLFQRRVLSLKRNVRFTAKKIKIKKESKLIK